MRIGEVFDEIQESYTEKMIRWVPHYLTLMEKLSGSFDQSWQPEFALDLGAGNGNITATLLPHFPRTKFTLLDASEKMLAEAQLRFEDRGFDFVQAMIQEVDFVSGSFDLIIASFSLHHLESFQKKEALNRIFDWLKPGGYFAYVDLFVDKKDLEHPQFIEDWKDFVLKYGQQGDWDYLFDHYNQYDFPDSIFTQLKWLYSLKFSEIHIELIGNYWTYIRAKK